MCGYVLLMEFEVMVREDLLNDLTSSQPGGKSNETDHIVEILERALLRQPGRWKMTYSELIFKISLARASRRTIAGTKEQINQNQRFASPFRYHMCNRDLHSGIGLSMQTFRGKTREFMNDKIGEGSGWFIYLDHPWKQQTKKQG